MKKSTNNHRNIGRGKIDNSYIDYGIVNKNVDNCNRIIVQFKLVILIGVILKIAILIIVIFIIVIVVLRPVSSVRVRRPHPENPSNRRLFGS